MTTNKNNKEEKRQMFFDMQEHPERYTDEQVEALLADEDIKAFFHDMAMTRMAQQKANSKKVDVDGAWKDFAEKHHLFDADNALSSNEPLTSDDALTEKLTSAKSPSSSSNRFKIAASIIGVIFLSGITFAAIHSGIFRSSSSDEATPGKTEQLSSDAKTALRDSTKAAVTEKTDSLNLKPVVFDNAELGDVISQLAAFYQVKVEFDNAEAQHIRIFFNWDKTKSLQQNLAILNAFDRIQITEEDGTLKVE